MINSELSSVEYADLSPIEYAYWKAHHSLKLVQLEGMRPQFTIVTEGKVHRVDFAISKLKVCVELDGFDTHSSTADIERDRSRDRRLMRAGWRVIRFGGAEVHRSAEACVKETALMVSDWIPSSSKSSLWEYIKKKKYVF